MEVKKDDGSPKLFRARQQQRHRRRCRCAIELMR
uniref:Uncharacterized protein n=1 Tax=Anopheles dirus TaxID=7168 RepID=A0A182NYQ1_9DIPT